MMRKLWLKRWNLSAIFSLLAVVGLVGLTGVAMANSVWAEDEGNSGEQSESGEQSNSEADENQISISISPVTANFDHLKSNATYDGVMNVTNAGKVQFDFEVYAAPYSFALNEATNDYGPDYASENNYTQIARWITIKDQAGNYVPSIENSSEPNGSHPVFSAAPGETVAVEYRITTPDNIPAGGQYATLFARTMPKEGEGSGISALANLGMKVFGRSEEGEAIQSAEITDMKLERSLEEDTQVEENGSTVTKKMSVDHINGYALVKNTGNLDFTATGKLTVTSIFGGDPYYQTPEGQGQVSIIPDSELPVKDEWKETPSFGLYRVNWTVTAGQETKSLEMVICLIPPAVIIIGIILLTIIIIWIIMMVRRRKERRSRFSI